MQFRTLKESCPRDGGTSLPNPAIPNPYPLFPALCYKRAAVNFAANPEGSEPAKACDSLEVASQASQLPGLRNEDPSRYCPVCSQRLESRRCKLICSVCGYYMSCADYY